jgi:hypothetical protein
VEVSGPIGVVAAGGGELRAEVPGLLLFLLLEES